MPRGGRGHAAEGMGTPTPAHAARGSGGDSSMWGLSTRFSLLNRTNEPKANYGGARAGLGSECKNVHRGGPHCHFRSNILIEACVFCTQLF